MNEIEIRISILRYLLANPSAEDTLDAIARWWIIRDRLELRKEQVRTIVSELVAEGILLNRGGRRYGLNPECIDEVRSWLSFTARDKNLYRPTKVMR